MFSEWPRRVLILMCQFDIYNDDKSHRIEGLFRAFRRLEVWIFSPVNDISYRLIGEERLVQ